MVSYQVGRLFSYILYGAVLGYFGQYLKIVFSPMYPFFGAIFLALVVGFVTWQSVSLWMGTVDQGILVKIQRRIFSPLLARVYRFFHSSPKNSVLKESLMPFGIGLLQALLPCGLILSLSGLAIASSDVSSSIWLYFGLWSGSLWALLAATSIYWRISRLSPRYAWARKALAGVILGVGVFSATQRFIMLGAGDSSSFVQSKRIHGSLYCQ